MGEAISSFGEVFGDASALFLFPCPRLVRESTKDFAQVQKLGLSEKPSSPECFSHSPIVWSGVLSWKGE